MESKSSKRKEKDVDGIHTRGGRHWHQEAKTGTS